MLLMIILASGPRQLCLILGSRKQDRKQDHHDHGPEALKCALPNKNKNPRMKNHEGAEQY